MSSLEQVLFSPVTKFLKLQTHTIKALERLGIKNIRDLLFHIPYNYTQKKLYPKLSDIRHGDHVITDIIIKEIQLPTRKSQPTKIYAESSCGPLVLVFFHQIPVFIFKKLYIGGKYIIEGTLELNDFYYQIRHPDFIQNADDNNKNIEPIYPLTYGLNNRQIVSYCSSTLRILDKAAFDIYANDNKSREYVIFKPILEALKKIHFPDKIDLEPIKTLAKYELLANQINLSLIRNKIHKIRGRSFLKASVKQIDILSKLGFTLTEGQKEALKEIEHDQAQEFRMIRMLQGDVGSGKTLVALLTILNVAANGVQSALMAPTDLLATQHYEFFSKNIEYVALLTSKTKPKDRKEILEKLENGEILILIGTHSIFQEKVNFKDLGYIVIDEQHRFGVEQRLELINKATEPDLLVMTATPIPRSLALTLFGDMANSRITSKPKGRLPIITTIISKTNTIKVMEALERKVKLGEKIYWICPLIEKNDSSELSGEEDAPNQFLMDAHERYKTLQKIYGDIVGIVHGRMKTDEKDKVMQEFKNGIKKILVATTVIEVGIDVPDATLIIIENAEKFGLAQLHQLRGRVGRSNLQSHAILLYENRRCSNIARQRLETIRKSEDGFYIAEQDLLLRGGGEILGTKQSGEQQFIFTDLARDMDLLNESHKYAANISEDKIQEFGLVLKLFSKHYKNADTILE